MSQESELVQNTEFSQHNKIVNVTVWGGILGLVASSPRKRLAKVIEEENLNGYRTVQVIESASGNILLWLWRLILLCITAFIYTTANGYYVILERK
jgi:hypothetical protein